MKSVSLEINVEEAVMLEEARKRKDFSSKAKLIKFFISELYKNEELKKEFRDFIINSNISFDDTITQNYTFILNDELHNKLTNLADEFTLTIKNFLRFLIHFIYKKTTT